ncbi:molybdate ABC transporter substrate-binding protein [Campylobacter porcelli]|uniref:Molybdenum ABC transporter ModABC, periplasmic molybdate-binding protein n=1 Tax=Campylobacter porcelli TaxID=1660073 RepID=A0A1X9SVN2_9BACT|nr:molybdate ABC transporter substrate-binding protein [Campylobacter sp. RM6137]ARR00236.1 molybdenum ABC transporter ModABC, periplasmic molybdate-binding protein [Campylobacter sp. RM6137]
MRTLLLILAFVICSFASNLNVAAAANTAYVLEETKREFIKIHPDAKINITLGSSGKLVAQIKNGAPFDLFLSANTSFADTLYKDGFAVDKPQIYTSGSVAILSVRGYEPSLNSLQNKDIKTIIIANPKTAPYGAATIEALKNAGIYDEIKHKIIESNSIGDALNQTIKAGDIGFVAASALKAKQMLQYTNYSILDSSLHTSIDQAMVILNNGKDNKLAKAFYDFILSKTAQDIFAKFGYKSID